MEPVIAAPNLALLGEDQLKGRQILGQMVAQIP